MERSKLVKIAGIKAGYPFRGRIIDVPGEDVRVVQMKDTSPDRGIDWNALCCTPLTGRRKPDWLVPGTILFMARGNHNFAVCMRDVPVKAVCAPHFFLLRVKPGVKIKPDFLAWQINQSPAQAYLKKSAEGSGARSIRRGILEALPVVVPPLAVQEKVMSMDRVFRQEQDVMQKLMKNRRAEMSAVVRGLLEGKDRSD